MIANHATPAVNTSDFKLANTGQSCMHVDRLDIFKKHWLGRIYMVNLTPLIIRPLNF